MRFGGCCLWAVGSGWIATSHAVWETCIQQTMEIRRKTEAQEEKIGLGVDEEPKDEIVNDSLGTIDAADTADTEPNDDPEIGGKGSGRKEDAA
jgi:hypothetical protein